MSIKKELRTTKERVAYILERVPSTRDNDKFLWLAYMNKHHRLKELLGDSKYQILKTVILEKEAPLFESIRKVRQKLQEEGQYIGKKRKSRMEAENEVREWTRERNAKKK